MRAHEFITEVLDLNGPAPSTGWQSGMNDKEFFAFDVIPGTNELKPAVATSLSNIYNGRWDIGLYATWSGAVNEQDVAEQQLDELNFLGSECTKDCSGHRAGYDWSKRKGLRQANSWSPSFNKGAGLAVAGK